MIVIPEPDTFEVSNLSTCDDDLDGDHTNGIVQNFDLDSLSLVFWAQIKIQMILRVTFHQSQEDASSGDNPINESVFKRSISYQQTIYTRVVNNSTLCVNDDFTFEVIVYPLPVFTVETPQIICLNDLPYTLNIESAQRSMTMSGLTLAEVRSVDWTTDKLTLQVCTQSSQQLQTEQRVLNHWN